MRHVIKTSSAGAAGIFCVLAITGLVSPIVSEAVAVRDGAPAVAAAPLRGGPPCAGTAWPYPPDACAGAGVPDHPAGRRVRLIAVSSEPRLR
jgi:hypothetical protein